MIGQCGVKPFEYWQMTEAETIAILNGHEINMCDISANFRNLYHIIYSVNSKKKKTPEQLWPLPSDRIRKKNSMDFETRMDLYSKIKGEC